MKPLYLSDDDIKLDFKTKQPTLLIAPAVFSTLHPSTIIFDKKLCLDIIKKKPESSLRTSGTFNY